MQTGGANCSYTYSDLGTPMVTGTGNLSVDPMFGGGGFRISSSSPCKDAADPAATLDVDYFGTARPQGPRSDMGAHESQ